MCRSPGQSHVASPDRGKCPGGDIDEPSVFVRQSTQAITRGLRFIVERDLTGTPKGRDRVCNSVVPAPVQRTKLVRRNFRILLDRYRGNGLANIPIFVNNLIDSVAEAQQFGAV